MDIYDKYWYVFIGIVVGVVLYALINASDTKKREVELQNIERLQNIDKILTDMEQKIEKLEQELGVKKWEK